MRLIALTFALALSTGLALALATAARAQEDDDPIFENGDWVIQTPGTLTILADGGGNVHDYADLIATLHGARVEIRGTCKSSCTMFLGLPGACVAPGAVIGFHGPRSNDQSIRNLMGLIDKIAAHHPPAIAERFRSDWGLSRTFTWVTGADLLALDPTLTPCPEATE